MVDLCVTGLLTHHPHSRLTVLCMYLKMDTYMGTALITKHIIDAIVNTSNKMNIKRSFQLAIYNSTWFHHYNDCPLPQQNKGLLWLYLFLNAPKKKSTDNATWHLRVCRLCRWAKKISKIHRGTKGEYSQWESNRSYLIILFPNLVFQILPKNWQYKISISSLDHTPS